MNNISSKMIDDLKDNTKHLATLFLMGRFVGQDDVPSIVLLWRGEVFPEIGMKFVSSFEGLELKEHWCVEVSNKVGLGIKIIPERIKIQEYDSSHVDIEEALELLRGDKKFMEDIIKDFLKIIEWIKDFDDGSS